MILTREVFPPCSMMFHAVPCLDFPWTNGRSFNMDTGYGSVGKLLVHADSQEWYCCHVAGSSGVLGIAWNLSGFLASFLMTFHVWPLFLLVFVSARADSWFSPVSHFFSAPYDITQAANARAFDWHNFCGSSTHRFAYGECVTTLEACGNIPLGKSGLTISGSNFNSDCTVLFVGIESVEYNGMCSADHLIHSSSPCRSHRFVFKELECRVLLFLFWSFQVLLVIVLFWWRSAVAEEELRNKQKRNSYWHLLLGMELWNEFWVRALCEPLRARHADTRYWKPTAIPNRWMGGRCGSRYCDVSVAAFDFRLLPWLCLASGLLAIGIGSYWGSCALITAYSASGLAVAGQHVFLNGIVQWSLNLINREALFSRLFEHFEKASPYSNVPSNEQRQGRAWCGARRKEWEREKGGNSRGKDIFGRMSMFD